MANPAASDYLYFVAKSADPADGHVFAETYAEHRKNVALYRKAAAEAEAEAAKEALEAEPRPRTPARPSRPRNNGASLASMTGYARAGGAPCRASASPSSSSRSMAAASTSACALRPASTPSRPKSAG